jgi:hypothetical protein
MSDFVADLSAAYATELPSIDLGRGVHEGQVHQVVAIKLPLRMVNRHGLIAGATGTGKTKTLQGIVEQLSAAGVPTVVADVKGDVSGLHDPGAADGPAPGRQAEQGQPYIPTGFPTEFFSIGGIGPGVPIRATVSDFGPQLMAKILESNETQEQSLQLVFHYADSKGLPLLDLSDLRALLTFLTSDEGKAELEGIGGLAKQTVGVLLRSLVGVETGGGTEFFGSPQLDISDLLRTAPDGRGIVNILELPAVQDKPGLFSTVLMWMLAELFETLPEVGDLDKPKLVFFFDEAHLLFKGATPAFVDSVVTTVRLIRSKGVGVFFITQNPRDVPADVLGQLGNRIQHALRVFTPEDEEALSKAVRTYPKSTYYDVSSLLTSVGTGEAAVTILTAKGTPTPVVHSRLPAPASRMSPTDDVEALAKASLLFTKYGTRLEEQSAREMLAARVDAATGAGAGAAQAGSAAGNGGAAAPAGAGHRGKAGGGRRGCWRRRGGGFVPQVARGPGAHARRGPRHLRDAQEVGGRGRWLRPSPCSPVAWRRPATAHG